MRKNLIEEIDSLFNEISNDIEIHIIDTPTIEINNVMKMTSTSRGLNIQQLINEINRKIKKGAKHIYIYDFYSEKMNIITRDVNDKIIYENLDTYWIRWFFTE